MGTKAHLVCDGRGVPLGVRLTPGQRHESTRLEPLVGAVLAEWPDVLPRKLAGDKGYSAARTRDPFVVYDYTPDRTRGGPAAWLGSFKGHLQADAYGGYDGIYATGVTEVACWAHARRKFFDARETDGRRAAEMLAMVAKLYAVEDEAKARVADLLKGKPDATADERHGVIRTLRQEASVPVLAEVKAWLDREGETVLPRSPMAGAIGYALNQWDALNRYAGHGFLNIDNNAAERALKRVAIGRKNWLFAGTDAAGASHARLWTLIASAERHALDPQRYLRSVLAKVAATPLNELGQFLPDRWKAEAAQADLHGPCPPSKP